MGFSRARASEKPLHGAAEAGAELGPYTDSSSALPSVSEVSTRRCSNTVTRLTVTATAAMCAALVLTGCARRSAEPTPTTPTTSDSASLSPTGEVSESASASPTDEGTPITTEQLQAIIATARQGLGASVGIDAQVDGATSWEQLFTGTADVDSGIATGEVSVGKAAGRERIIIDSTMYTKTLKRWVAVDLAGQGIAEGDVLQLWSLVAQITDARQMSEKAGSTITGKLPASMLVKALGKAFESDGAGDSASRLAAAAKGIDARAELMTDADGFFTHLTFSASLNVSGTPTTVTLHAMLSDYGQVLDVRKPVTGPVYTPEGQ